MKDLEKKDIDQMVSLFIELKFKGQVNHNNNKT
jgi:hypothetical protein